MKRIQLEPWTTYEKLCLASAVQTTGDQNWTAVSRAVKNIFDESTRALGTGWRRGRPPDWFNMRQCAAHYEHLLNSIVAPRRKKRTEKATNDPQVDSPAEIILSVLRQDYKEELRVELVEQQMAYLKLKKEIEDIQAGLLDDSLENMLAEAEAKEREKDIKIKLKFKLGEKNLEGDHSSTTIKSEPDVTAPHTESEVKSTSPLLTSLLQSPSPLTRHPPLMAPPPSTTTISHLLNSSPSVPSGETSTLTKLLESPTAAAVAASLMSSAHLMPAFTAPPPVSTVTPPTIVASSSSVVQPTTVMQSSVVASPAVGTPTATVASSTIVVSPPSEPRSVTAVKVPKLASPTPEELASVEKTQLNISSTVTVPSPSTLETVVEVKQEEEEPVSMDVDPPCTGTHSPVQLEAQIEEVQIKVDESEIVEEEEVVGEPIKDPTLEHAIEEIVHSEVETEIVIEPEEQIDDKKKGVVRRLDLGLCDDTTEEEVVETVERIIEKVEEAVILDDIEAEEEVLETVEQIIEKVEEAIIDTMEVGGSDDMANDVQTVTGEASSDVSGSEARSLNQTLESEATEDALDSLELDQEAVELIVVGPNQPSKVISVHHETSSETQNDSSKSDELSEVKDLDSTEIMNEESNLSEDGDQKEEIILDNQSTVAKIEVKDNMGDQLKEIIKSEDIKSEDITDSTVKLEELDTDVVEEHEVHSEEVVLAEEVIAEESSEQVLIAEGNTDNEEAILDKVVEQSEEEHKMDVDNVSETLLETVEHTSSEEQVASSESVKVDTITVTAESTEDIKTAAGRTTDLRGKKVDIIESKEIVLTEAKTVDVKVRSSREDEKCETPSKQNTEKKQSDIELKSSTSSDVAIQPDKSSPTPVKPPKHQPSPANAQVQAVKESKKVSVGTPDKCDSPLATIQSEKETPPVESERKRGGRKRAVILLSDSKPNSPASSILTEEDRDYKSWKKSILLVYNRLAAHKYASVFLKPITEAEAAGYHSIIKRPMDLTTIKRNIETGVIRTTVEFQRDMLLMVQNAIMYNKTNTLVYKMANDMLADMITQMEVMVQAIGDGVPLGRDTYERLPTRGRAAAKAAVTAGTDTPKRKRNSGPDDRPTTKRNKYDSSSAM